MPKKNLSNYQKQVVNDYYRNLQDIMLDKLQNLVTDLYLADSEKKRHQLWKRTASAMEKLKIPPKILEHIINKKDVRILAKNLQDWLKNPPK